MSGAVAKSRLILLLIVVSGVGGVASLGSVIRDSGPMPPPSELVYFGDSNRRFLRSTFQLSHPSGRLLAAAESSRVILDFATKLKAAGVHLIVLPGPEAPMIYPECIWKASAEPACNGAYGAWLAKLREAGVDVVDCSAELSAGRRSGRLIFPPHNSHWAPAAVAIAAKALATRVQPLLGERRERHDYTTSTRRYAMPSDLNRDLPRSWKANRVNLDCVAVEEDGQFVDTQAPAPVLLLGDSYATIYEGDGADLGRHMALHLGMPVQVLGRACYTPAHMLQMLEKSGPAPATRRVVIWEFASRHLTMPENWNTSVEHIN